MSCLHLMLLLCRTPTADNSLARTNQDSTQDIPAKKISLLSRPFALGWRERNKVCCTICLLDFRFLQNLDASLSNRLFIDWQQPWYFACWVAKRRIYWEYGWTSHYMLGKLNVDRGISFKV